jgi:pyridoxamine 5'-phosphate oxidase
LTEAIDVGVAEPHAMVVSTRDDEGIPDARVLILKDLDDRGWWFATSSSSVTGRQLAAHRGAALTFYWPLIGRQVRVRGPVVQGSAEENAADFLARSEGARAIALASNQSWPLPDIAERIASVEAAQRRLADDPALVSPTWTLYAVVAGHVEFWQADKDRQHARVSYDRSDGSWTHQLLWP